MRRLVLCVAGCVLSVVCSASAAPYAVTDIGAIGGFIHPLAINNKNQVVGTGYTGSSMDSQHFWGFLCSNGELTQIPTFGGTWSEAHSINDSGMVVGSANTEINTGKAFTYKNGQMTMLDSQYGGTGTAINNAGDIVVDGYADAAHGWRAVIHRGDERIVIPSFGGRDSASTHISENGYVTGYANTASGSPHAFLYANGNMTDLNILGGDNSAAYAVNSRGQVVGYYHGLNDNGTAFLYSGGQMVGLFPVLSGGSVAYDINELGQIVGSRDGVAFLYQDGRSTDLNALIPPDSGWILEGATAINDIGSIAGYGHLNGEIHAFLLTVVPEPSAIGLALGACLAVFGGRSRTRA